MNNNSLQFMGRGPSLDVQELQERQRLIEQMRQASQMPQAPERHWTQGLARLVQGFNAGIEGGRLQQDREMLKQQRQMDMQKLAGVLSGQKYSDVLPTLETPEAQQMGLGMAHTQSQKDAEREFRKSLQQEKMQSQKELAQYKAGLRAASQPLDLQREYANQAYQAMASGQPLTQAQQMALSNSRMSPTINLGEKGLTEEQKIRGKAYGTQYEKSLENAETARTTDDLLDQVTSVLDEAKAGPGFNQRKYVATMAQFVGIDPEKLGVGDPRAMTIVNQKLNEYVLERMKSLKGPQTDRDREVIERSKPNPNDTPEQIRASINNLKKVNARTIEYAESQDKWIDQYGSLAGKDPSGKSFNQKWNEYTKAHPLFSPPSRRG